MNVYMQIGIYHQNFPYYITIGCRHEWFGLYANWNLSSKFSLLYNFCSKHVSLSIVIQMSGWFRHSNKILSIVKGCSLQTRPKKCFSFRLLLLPLLQPPVQLTWPVHVSFFFSKPGLKPMFKFQKRSLVPATWKSCLSGWKFMDSHKTHKAFIQMANWLEQTLGHNECCSVPSPCSVPAWDLCERHTFTKHKNKQ